MISFIFLYLHDHSQLQEYRNQATEKTLNINHRERLEKRSERVKHTCNEFNNSMKLEHNALYFKEKIANPCTGTHFQLADRSHFICNVLKGGSTSWEMFFAENRIVHTKIADCYADVKKCPDTSDIKIIQVRHPFERLLSTYRHLFKNGGWKSLDAAHLSDPKLEQDFIRLFSKSWPQFVEEVVIQNELYIKEDDLRNINHPGSWLKTHWAPYWWTCDVCGQLPDFVLKTETLPWDLPVLLESFGLESNLNFPDIRVTGSDDDFSEGNRVTKEFIGKYYSQLTRRQILELWEIYKTDFLLFDYSIDKYLEMLEEL